MNIRYIFLHTVSLDKVLCLFFFLAFIFTLFLSMHLDIIIICCVWFYTHRAGDLPYKSLKCHKPLWCYLNNNK